MTNFTTIKSNSNNFNSKPAYKKHSTPVLPEGTFRSGYIKDLALTYYGHTIHFTFEICQNIESGYRIYILSCPKLLFFDGHEAHYYATNDGHYIICWDGYISSFKDANAIMFVWAKNYLINCLGNRREGYTPSLPLGVFRAKKQEKKHTVKETMLMTKEVYDAIYSTIGSKVAEQGGMLGTTDGITIDTFVYDKSANTSCASYSPNTAYLNPIIQNWYENGIELIGFVHSHPVYFPQPSSADLEYAQQIMNVFDLNYFAMPIVLTVKDNGKFVINCNAMKRTENGSFNFVDRIKLMVVDSRKQEKLGTQAISIEAEESDDLFKSFMEKYQDASYDILEDEKFKEIDKEDTIKSQQEKGENEMKEDLIKEYTESMSEDIKSEEHEEIPSTETEVEQLEDTPFNRINNVIDLNKVADCLLIGVGCGGSREFYIDMARLGIKNYVLMDGDTVSSSNISSQNTYLSEVGKYKAEAIKAKLEDIDPSIKVKAINEFLTDEFDDEYFENLIKEFGCKTVLICAYTDGFYAQARCARLAMKYNCLYIAGQHYEKGLMSEIIYYIPNYSCTTQRQYLKARYDAYLNNGYKNKVTSKGSPIFNTTRINSLCEKVALGMIVFTYDSDNEYCKFMLENPTKNLILIRQHKLNGGFGSIEEFFTTEGNYYSDDCIFLGAEDFGIEEECKDTVDYCNNALSFSIDTRTLK